jgi:phosphoserine phosphatase
MDEKKDFVMVTVSGPDQPGITAAFSKILVDNQAEMVSGGFDYFADFLKGRLNLDFSFANQLEIKNGALTGKVLGKIVDNTYKARVVNMVSSEAGVLLDQTVAIGDGANDVLMLGQAGLGIAYNAKEKVERAANMSLGRARLKNILYILGISEEGIEP